MDLGDLDHDGFVDLAVVVRYPAEYGLLVRWGGDDAALSAPEVLWRSSDCCPSTGPPRIVDADGDGQLDVVVLATVDPDGYGAVSHKFGAVISYGGGDRTFERQAMPIGLNRHAHGGARTFFADLDGDGRDDILLDGGVWARASGPRTYEPAVTYYFSQIRAEIDQVVAVHDLDRDGERDVLAFLVDGYRMAVHVLPGFGDGREVSPILLPDDASSYDLSVVERDGEVVIFGSGSPGGELRVWSLASDGDYDSSIATERPDSERSEAPYPKLVWGPMRSGDVDGDDAVDFLFPRRHANYPLPCDLPSAWRGVDLVLGTGAQPPCHVPLDMSPIEIGTADFNGDGLSDVVGLTAVGVELLLSDP